MQLASGEVFGQDQPIALKLLGSERSFQALEGKRLLSALLFDKIISYFLLHGLSSKLPLQLLSDINGWLWQRVCITCSYVLIKTATVGVAMELEDSLYPLLREVSIGIDPYEVFEDVDWALLIGAKPRGPGMERAALLDINGQIFADQVSFALRSSFLLKHYVMKV